MNKFLDTLYKNRKYVSVILILLIILVGCFLFFRQDTDDTPKILKTDTTLTLFGNEKITLTLGEEYIEPGFYAVDGNGNIKTNLVVVDNHLDINKSGLYTITYQIDNVEKKRVIEVLEPVVSKELSLDLVGEDVVTLNLNDVYQEPGYQAFYDTVNLTNKVTVSGKVDTSHEGTYTIHYAIEYNNQKKEMIRTIIVVSSNLYINLIPDKTSYTNSSVMVTVEVVGNDFLTLVLPNKVVTKEEKTTYEITNNGTYIFTAYSKNGKSFQKEITIQNIDKAKPAGSCTATIQKASTTIHVTASDNVSGVKNYLYYDNLVLIGNTNYSSFTYSKKTSKNVKVKIIDNASNQTEISCSVIDNSAFDPIQPGKNENLVKKAETNTLKVYITKKSGYYITRIWAYNPYQQLNKYDSPEYGKKLYTPKKLLEMAKKQYNLNNQLLVGFNASGFYLKNTYDSSSVSKYSKYNKTSVGTLVITNGKVIRNAYDKAYKTWYVTGVDSNNNLRIFTDRKGTSKSDIANHKSWASEVINSGIRNTFTFASPLVINGVKSTITKNMPSSSSKLNRQAICQVNANNFVLITGKNLNRSDLINIMLNLHCQTGTNLDGGGSIALLYKNKNTSSIQTIIGNGRSLTEVGYFTE